MGALVLTCLEELRQFKAQYGAETETPLPNFTTVEEVMDFAPDDAKKTELVSSIQIAADQIYEIILAWQKNINLFYIIN